MSDANTPAAATAAAQPRKKHGGLSFALDFGPLLLFFMQSMLHSSRLQPRNCGLF